MKANYIIDTLIITASALRFSILSPFNINIAVICQREKK